MFFGGGGFGSGSKGQVTEDGELLKLQQCSSCHLAKFCGKECQAIAWKEHKVQCKELAKLPYNKHMLPYTCQVIRYRDGAHIANKEEMVRSLTVKYRRERKLVKERMMTFLLGTHTRLGKESVPGLRKLAGIQLVKHLIYDFLVAEKPNRRLRKSERGHLSACALDHLPEVRALTPEQRNHRYALACEERWGASLGQDHCWEEDGLHGVPLNELLNSAEPCNACGGDGEQYFSFCLNRAVNEDRVQHCEWCGRCGYYRPGCMAGCEHCGMGYGDRGEAKLFRTNARGCKVPPDADYTTKGLAAEGYWGY